MIFQEVIKREYYTLIRLAKTENQQEMVDVEKWCFKMQCGKRVNRTTTFIFKTDAEITMFRLRWETFE
jgi:hypothetical protein